MNFTKEMQQVLASPEYKADSGTPAAVKAADDAAVKGDGTEMLNTGMIESIPTEEVSTPPPLEASEPPVIDAKKETKVKIGGQEFDSVEAALKYANDLELAVLQQDAFQAGKAEATKTPEAAPIDPYKEAIGKIANGVFEDPEKAIEEIIKVAEQKAEEKIKKHQEDADKRAKQVETTKQLWNTFYDANADLVANHETVQYVLEKNWAQLEKMKPAEALPLLAEKTRALLGSYKEAKLPSKELPSGPAITAGASGNATTTPKPAAKTALDFISQVNKHRKRETAQSV